MAGNASHDRAGLPDRGPDVGAVNGSSARFSSHDAQEESSPSDTNGDRALTIGEVAQEYGITLRTLRFYEAKRLLNPYRHGATRLYRSSDRKRLSVILTGRRLGFTLAEIKHLLNRPQDGGFWEGTGGPACWKTNFSLSEGLIPTHPSLRLRA